MEHSSTKLLQKDDIIISARGTVGEMAMIPFPMAFNQSCYGIRGKECIDKSFLYYLLKNNIHKLKAITHGSVFDTITKDTFAEIEITLPDLKTQKKISSVLSAIDNKIELNNKINENFEEQAQIMFKYYFADFKPNGILSNIAGVTMGQSPKGTSYNEKKIGVIFFQGRTDFGYRFPNVRMYTTEPKKIAEKGDILISVRAPVGALNIVNRKCCIGRGLASVRSKNNHSSFLFYTLQNMKSQLDMFNGEGTVFGSINQKSLKELSIAIPPYNLIEEFEKTVSKTDKMMENNYNENKYLSEIRDALLPKLLNGEIDISKI